MATQFDTATTLGTGQVPVTPSAAVLIAAVRATRTKLTLTSTVPIFIGDSNAVSATTGYPPFGTNAGGINYDIPTQDAVWAIAVGGAGTVFFSDYHN